jgi:lipopolysaccharide/colanic/teichoic acid biosynthesis glycosyltransferase
MLYSVDSHLNSISLVGTRPPTEEEFLQYEVRHKRRLSLKPGITGLWQVSGISDIENFEDVVRLDLEYIDNWSLLTDIKLLFKTVAVVLLRVGAK